MKKRFVLSAILLTALFALFGIAVLSYVSLSVPVGPWIDLTLALISLGIICIATRLHVSEDYRSALIIATAAGSIGGIIASAIAWSIPTLYFLDRLRFAIWCAQPAQFIGGIFCLVVAAGSLGLLMARYARNIWGAHSQYTFPIAQLVLRTFTALQNTYQLLLLVGGVCATLAFHALQCMGTYIPHTMVMLQQRRFAWWCFPRLALNIDMAPMYWSIGFIAGRILAVPFAVGIFLKIMGIDPCYRTWFAETVSEANFIMAFCTGLVVQGALHGFWKLLSSLRRATSLRVGSQAAWEKLYRVCHSLGAVCTHVSPLELFGTLGLCAFFLSRIVELSYVGIVYVMVGTMLCSYQLILLMARVGLAPLGRFALFVLAPGLLLFGYNSVQATLVAAFVEVAGGVAASASSGMRVAAVGLEHYDDRLIYRYQWIALVVSAVSVGLLLLFLINHFGLGSVPLLAQRAQSRALLIRAHHMHLGVVLIGLVVGCLVHRVGINTTLLLGGILMPINESILIVCAGLSSCLVRRPEAWEPFWSGVFTASSLWLMVRALLS